MVISCSAAGCSNRQRCKPNLAFYRIPFDPDRRLRWLQAINRKNWQPSKYSRICSEHFLKGKKSDNPFSPDYVPSLFTKSHAKKKKKRQLSSTSEASLLYISSHMTGPQENTENAPCMHYGDVMCQKALGTEHIQLGVSECQVPRSETIALKERLSLDFLKQKSFQNKDKLEALTGLHNYQVLMAIVDLVKPALKDTTHMTCFQQLLITLMRLRINLPISFFSCLFGVHNSTLCQVFTNVINVLNDLLVPVCLLWPKREKVQASMPMCFKESFRHCLSVIDCFQINVEKPPSNQNLKARAQTDSQYKSHSTIKYLIGCTPQGVISFVSKGWGGRTTDALIAENSGFLDHFLPGDLILTDCGFTIQSQVGLCCVQVETAVFTQGKKQLSTVKLEETQSLAAVHAHVKKVTGKATSKYKMLNGPVHISFLSRDDVEYTTLDKVVRVICALTNLSPSAVPTD